MKVELFTDSTKKTFRSFTWSSLNDKYYVNKLSITSTNFTDILNYNGCIFYAFIMSKNNNDDNIYIKVGFVEDTRHVLTRIRTHFDTNLKFIKLIPISNIKQGRRTHIYLRNTCHDLIKYDKETSKIITGVFHFNPVILYEIDCFLCNGYKDCIGDYNKKIISHMQKHFLILYVYKNQLFDEYSDKKLIAIKTKYLLAKAKLNHLKYTNFNKEMKLLKKETKKFDAQLE